MKLVICSKDVFNHDIEQLLTIPSVEFFQLAFENEKKLFISTFETALNMRVVSTVGISSPASKTLWYNVSSLL